MDYMEQLRVKMEDFIDNTANRVPICIVVDNSFSMVEENRIQNVNKGIQAFIKNSADDEYAVDSLDLCIISFDGDDATVVHPFTNVAKLRMKFVPLEAKGQTPLGKAVKLALKEIDNVMKNYIAQGVTVFKPWLVIMSDGESTDDIKAISWEVKKRLRERKMKIKCIDMGDGSGKGDLNKFTIDGVVDTITSLQIEDFFMLLSRSAVALSTSIPGEDYLNTIL